MPYGRLALNQPFATLWTGGLLSLFGDRVNQTVLAIFIYQQTNSLIATSFVFFAATVPNLVFGSLAGTFVDRVNQKSVLILSDLLRAGIVFVLPIAAVTNTLLVFPVVFLVTTVSIFFRPAREAVIPRIVPSDDLMAANSATWLAETLADIIGYALAGLLVLVLGSNFALAFWFDSATYVVSAALIASVAIPVVIHRTDPSERTFRGDFLEGWRFLRNDAVLFANTLQGIAGQVAIGVLLPLSAIYALTVIKGGSIPGTIGLRLPGRRDRDRQPDRRRGDWPDRQPDRQGPAGDRRLRRDRCLHRPVQPDRPAARGDRPDDRDGHRQPGLRRSPARRSSSSACRGT